VSEIACFQSHLTISFRHRIVCVKRRIIESTVLGCLSIFLSCTSKIDPPPRPAGVPQSAVWAGGADGGAFIDCRVNTDGSDACVVYNDYTGQPWTRGEAGYVLEGKARGATQDELKYLGTDGERIFLTNGETLVPRR